MARLLNCSFIQILVLFCYQKKISSYPNNSTSYMVGRYIPYTQMGVNVKYKWCIHTETYQHSYHTGYNVMLVVVEISYK